MFDICNGGRGTVFIQNNPNVKDEGGVLTCSCGLAVWLKQFHDNRNTVDEPIIEPIDLEEVGENLVELGGRLYKAKNLRQMIIESLKLGNAPAVPHTRKELSMTTCRQIMVATKVVDNDTSIKEILTGFDATFENNWCTAAAQKCATSIWSRCNGITNTGIPYYAVAHFNTLTIDLYHPATFTRNILRIEIQNTVDGVLIQPVFICFSKFSCVLFTGKYTQPADFHTCVLASENIEATFTVAQILAAFHFHWNNVLALIGPDWDATAEIQCAQQ